MEHVNIINHLVINTLNIGYQRIYRNVSRLVNDEESIHSIYFNFLSPTDFNDKIDKELNSKVDEYEGGNDYLKSFKVNNSDVVPVNKDIIIYKILNCNFKIINEYLIKHTQFKFLLKLLIEIKIDDVTCYGVTTIRIIKDIVVRYNVITHVYHDYGISDEKFNMKYKNNILKNNQRCFDFQFSTVLYYCKYRNCMMPICLDTVLLKQSKQIRELSHEIFEELKNKYYLDDIREEKRKQVEEKRKQVEERLKKARLENERMIEQCRLNEIEQAKQYLMSISNIDDLTKTIITNLFIDSTSLYRILTKHYNANFNGIVYYHFKFDEFDDEKIVHPSLKKFELDSDIKVDCVKSDLTKKVVDLLLIGGIYETVGLSEFDIDKFFDIQLSYTSKSKFNIINKYVNKTQIPCDIDFHGICVLSIRQRNKMTEYMVICHVYHDPEIRDQKFNEISDFDYIQQFETMKL